MRRRRWLGRGRRLALQRRQVVPQLRQLRIEPADLMHGGIQRHRNEDDPSPRAGQDDQHDSSQEISFQPGRLRWPETWSFDNTCIHRIFYMTFLEPCPIPFGQTTKKPACRTDDAGLSHRPDRERHRLGQWEEVVVGACIHVRVLSAVPSLNEGVHTLTWYVKRWATGLMKSCKRSRPSGR